MDGRKFDSNPEKIPSIAKPQDSASFKVLNEKEITDNGVEVSYWKVNIILSTSLPKNDNGGFYRWSVSEVWNIFPTCPPNAIECPRICYIYEPTSLYNLLVVKSSDYSNGALNNYLLMSHQ